MRSNRRSAAVAFVWALAATTAAFMDEPRSSLAAAQAETLETSAAAENVRVFDEAWREVRESFYDPKLQGLDWTAVGRKYRAEATLPKADVAEVINRMLAELKSSHTGYYTPDDIAYYDLADIFSHSLRHELEKRFAKGEVAYEGIGMVTRVIDGRHFISGLLAGFPAAAAGLAVGERSSPPKARRSRPSDPSPAKPRGKCP